MYALSAGIASSVLSRVPDTYRRPAKTAWAQANRGGDPVDCFDIPFGRIVRVSSNGEWTVAAGDAGGRPSRCSRMPRTLDPEEGT
jgi:hypothetical protein